MESNESLQTNTESPNLEQFACEACGHDSFTEFNYPINWEYRLDIEKRKRTYRKVIRNNIRYVIGSVIARLPSLPVSRYESLRERAVNRSWLSRGQISTVEKTLRKGASFFDGRTIRICLKCGLGVTYPMPDETVLDEYYRTSYWLALESRLPPADNPRTRTLYGLADSFGQLGDASRSIELGSADAALTRYFKLMRPNLNTSVIEPGKNWQTMLRDHIDSIFPNINAVSGEYDLFLSSHSLEHIPDLSKYMGQITHMLKPGALLVIEVPNSEESTVIFSDNVPDYHIPHTYFFSPDSFNYLAAKWGLQIHSIKTYNRSYSQIYSGVMNGIDGTMENPAGAYLRIILSKVG